MRVNATDIAVPFTDIEVTVTGRMSDGRTATLHIPALILGNGDCTLTHEVEDEGLIMDPLPDKLWSGHQSHSLKLVIEGRPLASTPGEPLFSFRMDEDGDDV